MRTGCVRNEHRLSTCGYLLTTLPLEEQQRSEARTRALRLCRNCSTFSDDEETLSEVGPIDLVDASDAAWLDQVVSRRLVVRACSVDAVWEAVG